MKGELNLSSFINHQTDAQPVNSRLARINCWYCWNALKCQVTDTEFCHEECLGCTQNLSASHCHACKNFDDHGLCVKTCPEDK
nr:unnamed protein product [Callosobruchus analis]